MKNMYEPLMFPKFEGKLKKIKLISNSLCYGPMPYPNKEIEQRLTIKDNGSVKLKRKTFAGKKTKEAFEISPESIERIFKAFFDYFSNDVDYDFVTDVGTWDLKLTNTDGKTFKYKGSLYSKLEEEDINLSDLIREELKISDLFVFDNECKYDTINRIEIDYSRVTKVASDKVPENAAFKKFTIEYGEHLIIDRETETIEHIQQIGTGCKITNKFEVEGGVSSLIDRISCVPIFSYVEGNPDDVIDNPDETKDYKITVAYENTGQRVIEGTFDKRGLPSDYPDFVMDVMDFLTFYRIGDLLDPDVYEKTKRRATDLIYLSVAFEEGDKTYYYITDDDSLERGDFVLVPAGRDNHEAIVCIENKEYFAPENVPLPVEKTKKVIRKLDDEETESAIIGDYDLQK